MSIAKVSQSVIDGHFKRLSKIGNLGPRLEDGFLRAPWSDEESQAIHYIRECAGNEGLQCEFDAVGNLFVRTPGDCEGIIQLGSHLDTVPRGGMYDGGAGIVAGLEAIVAVKRSYRKLKVGLELVVWRGEESATYRALYMGSLAAFGQANPSYLTNEFKGRSLEQAILSQGFDPSPIRERRPTLEQSHVDRIVGHFELHIEQARSLEVDQIDIGIVTSIRAPRRYRVVIRGESAHSGATPMGKTYRKDAVLAISYINVRLNETLREFLSQGADLVQTVGVVNCEKDFEKHTDIFENAMTKVSEFGYFLLDIRGSSKNWLDRYTEKALEVIRLTAEEFGTDLEIEELAKSDPLEQLDSELQSRISSTCDILGYSYLRIPSGAGHDAVVVAKQCRSDGTGIPTAMIFIPCRDGISHNPLEYASGEAVTKGAQVLAQVLGSYQGS